MEEVLLILLLLSFLKTYAIEAPTPTAHRITTDSIHAVALAPAIEAPPLTVYGRGGPALLPVTTPPSRAPPPLHPVTTPPSRAPPPPPPPPRRKFSIAIIIAIIAAIATSVILICIGYSFFQRKATTDQAIIRQHESVMEYMSSAESLKFDLSTIQASTNNFAYDNKLGEGGFGAVYKGTLSNGQNIAVKRLSRSSGQGSNEFENEVAVVAKLQHRNLVRLFGFCLEGEEKLLVYELMPNKSLDYFLFGQTELFKSNKCKIN